MKRAIPKIAELSLRSMSVRVQSTLMAVLLALPFLLSAVPGQAPRDNLNATLNQLRTSVVDLKNNVQNHETEIRTFEEKLHTQESSFEALREQLVAASEELHVLTKNNSVNLESKVASLDTGLNGLVADVRQMKTQANDTVTVISQYKQKLGEIEKLIDAQNQHMAQLEAALKSMMAVIQGSSDASPSSQSVTLSGNTYKVQPGDTLDKIAKKHNVSLKALKDANQLANDRIIVGQNLKIPQ